MSRSYKKHAMLYVGYWGKRITHKKASRKLSINVGTKPEYLEDFDDNLVTTRKANYKRAQGMRVVNLSCCNYQVLPKGRYKNHRIPIKQPLVDGIPAYSLTSK